MDEGPLGPCCSDQLRETGKHLQTQEPPAHLLMPCLIEPKEVKMFSSRHPCAMSGRG